jgi:thiamine biosynthesis lipoprotein
MLEKISRPVFIGFRNATLPVAALRFALALMLCFSFGFATPASGQSAELNRYEYKARHMGIVARVVVYAEAEADALAGARAAFSRIEALEAVFSNYRTDSEVELLARAPTGTPIAVSADLLRVMLRSDTLWRESGGAFDVTVGSLSELWREAISRGELPDMVAIAKARASTGWRHVALDTTAQTVTIGHPGIVMDFGAIAKGFAADEALRVLRVRGLSRALVELGGDIVVGDPPPGEEGWIIDGTEFGAVKRLVVANAGVSTSGDSQQHVVVDDIRYSHIVDPRTGVGLTNGVTVTVVAKDGLTSDGLSTTVSVLDEAAGRALAERVFPDARVYARDW